METSSPSIGKIVTIVLFTLSCIGLLLFLWLSFGGTIPFNPQGYEFRVSFPNADQLADQQITLNAVNPGPVDTGYASPEAYEAVRRHFPQHRWGVPDDPARLIAWLVTDEAAWITGQVINSEGGFRRWA